MRFLEKLPYPQRERERERDISFRYRYMYPYLCCSLLDETDEEVRTKEDDGVAAAVDVTVAGGAQPQADGQPDPQPPTPP